MHPTRPRKMVTLPVSILSHGRDQLLAQIGLAGFQQFSGRGPYNTLSK